MKKIILTIVLLISGILIAQDFSYGLVIGNSVYSIDNNNGVNTMSQKDYNTFVFGAYGEYYFSNKIAIKNDVLFFKNNFYFRPTQQPFEMNIFTIAPNLKYDFGQVQRDGFYMLVGPKFSFVTSATSADVDVKDTFENFLYGLQLGFGHRVFKYIDLQIKLDYDIAPFFELENGNRSKFFAGIVTANIDIAKIFAK